MNTPNLDALLAQATQSTSNIIVAHRADMKKRQLDKLFAEHGPAMVAVLKRMLQSPGWMDAMNRGDENLCADIIALLITIDEEAKG